MGQTVASSKEFLAPDFNTYYLTAIDPNTLCNSLAASAKVIEGSSLSVGLVDANACENTQGTLQALIPSGTYIFQWMRGTTDVTVDPLSPTFQPPIGDTHSYTVRATSATGCTGVSPAAKIVVLDLPVVALSDKTICAGDSRFLVPTSITPTTDASGTILYSYNWLNSANVTVGNSSFYEAIDANTYSLIVTDPSTLCSSVPVSAKVVVAANLSVGLSDVYVCQSSAGTLKVDMGSGGFTYQWMQGNVDVTIDPLRNNFV